MVDCKVYKEMEKKEREKMKKEREREKVYECQGQVVME
jgi:hypothetical protein